MATVLVVDDEKNIRTHLVAHLEASGHAAEAAGSAAEALAVLARKDVDVVFSDVRMAEMDGMALLAEIRRSAPASTVVLMTAYATVKQAVEAMRAGAYDYLVKPFSLDEVDVVLARIVELSDLKKENRRLRSAIATSLLLASNTPSMQHALATARRAAESDVTILLTGESGTGKNLLARQIHAWSARRAGPFVTLACTTLADDLLESELFGHVKGAYTGAWKDSAGRLEAAAGGTLFLDEVGDLSSGAQGKLLRFLEERKFERVGGTSTIEVDARVVAATHRDLDTEVESGQFRRDLFFRMNVVSIRLPALRERPRDIEPLVDDVLDGLAVKHARTSITLTPAARNALVRYDWPGNVREMANALERAVVLARREVIDISDLPDRLAAPSPQASAPAATGPLDEMERHHITRALAESATLEEAAARLGINVTTLWRKRKRFGID